MGDDVVEKFHPTSGAVMGVVGVLACLVVVVYGILTAGFPAPAIWVAGIVGVLIWASSLRPRVAATSSELVLRNMLSTTALPLAAIEQVVVSQVLSVRVGEKRYVSPAVGKSWRQAARSNREVSAGPGSSGQVPDSYPAYVEERITRLAEDARAQAGVQHLSDEQLELAAGVRRDWAWPEIGALAVSTVGLAAALVV